MNAYLVQLRKLQAALRRRAAQPHNLAAPVIAAMLEQNIHGFLAESDRVLQGRPGGVAERKMGQKQGGEEPRIKTPRLLVQPAPQGLPTHFCDSMLLHSATGL